MAFRVVTALCALILLYSAFEWGRIEWRDKAAVTPKAAFLVLSEGGEQTVSFFTDYRCGNCAAAYRAFDDLRELRPELRYIARPVAYIDEQSELLARLVLAAGTEGRFDALHTAFLEKGGAFPE